MTTDPDQKEFESYLDGKSSVSHQYSDLADETPPAELTAKILADAERSVKLRPWPYGRMAQRWMKPMAFAATVLIALSVVMNIVMQPAPVMDAEVDLLEFGSAEQVVRPASKTPVEPGWSPSRRAAEAQLDSGGQGVAIENHATLTGLIAPAVRPDLAPVIKELRARHDEKPVLVAAAPAGDSERAVVRTMSSQPEKREKVTADSASATADAEPDSGEELPEKSLQRILQLYDDNELEPTWRAIDDFREDFPDHAFTVWLENEGY